MHSYLLRLVWLKLQWMIFDHILIHCLSVYQWVSLQSTTFPKYELLFKNGIDHEKLKLSGVEWVKEMQRSFLKSMIPWSHNLFRKIYRCSVTFSYGIFWPVDIENTLDLQDIFTFQIRWSWKYDQFMCSSEQHIFLQSCTSCSFHCFISCFQNVTIKSPNLYSIFF